MQGVSFYRLLQDASKRGTVYNGHGLLWRLPSEWVLGYRRLHVPTKWGLLNEIDGGDESCITKESCTGALKAGAASQSDKILVSPHLSAANQKLYISCLLI